MSSAVSLRRVPRVVGALLLLLAACATAHQRTLPSRDEPVHDPAVDWQGERATVQPAPRARGVPSGEPIEPPPELRAFTDSELSRIRKVQPIVHSAAREHDLPADLVNGIIWVESKFEVKARGRKGPRGLMQLMPRTGREIARQIELQYLPFNANFNIRAGTYYFARMVQRYDGNLTLALAAYHIGPAHVDRWVRDNEPLPEVTRTYVERVFTAARAFRSRYP
jgi:soluble lytic murein transglycosylase-like protein